MKSTQDRTPLIAKVAVEALANRIIRQITVLARENRKKQDTFFDRFGRFAQFAQNISIVGGIFVAFFTFFVNQYNIKVDRVFEFRKEFVERDLEKYLYILKKWNDESADPSFFSENREKYKQQVLLFFLDPKNKTEFDQIEDFFQSLWICVDSKRCDRNSASDIFQEYVNFLFEVFEPYIIETRKQNRNITFADGLQKLYVMKHEWLISQYNVL